MQLKKKKSVLFSALFILFLFPFTLHTGQFEEAHTGQIEEYKIHMGTMEEAHTGQETFLFNTKIIKGFHTTQEHLLI